MKQIPDVILPSAGPHYTNCLFLPHPPNLYRITINERSKSYRHFVLETGVKLTIFVLNIPVYVHLEVCTAEQKIL
jgi:hypothetical protein